MTADEAARWLESRKQARCDRGASAIGWSLTDVSAVEALLAERKRKQADRAEAISERGRLALSVLHAVAHRHHPRGYFQKGGP